MLRFFWCFVHKTTTGATERILWRCNYRCRRDCKNLAFFFLSLSITSPLTVNWMKKKKINAPPAPRAHCSCSSSATTTVALLHEYLGTGCIIGTAHFLLLLFRFSSGVLYTSIHIYVHAISPELNSSGAFTTHCYTLYIFVISGKNDFIRPVFFFHLPDK